MAEPYLNETNTSTELKHEVGRLNKRLDFIADKLEKAKIKDITAVTKYRFRKGIVKHGVQNS